MIKLSVISYNNEPPAQPLSAVFDDAGGTIGRNGECHLVLADPRRHVSRLQASVSSNGDQHTIVNLSQANGLLVNGQELTADQEYAIHDGDEIIVGLYVLRVDNVILDASCQAASTESMSEHARHALPLEAELELAMPLWPDIAGVESQNAAPGSDSVFADLISGLDLNMESHAHQTIGDFDLCAPTAANENVDSQQNLTASTLHAVPSRRSATAESNLVHVDFDDLLTGSTHRTPMPQQSGSAIPADFNPFNLPSDTARNSADPLDAFSGKEISLASFEDRIAGSLIAGAADSSIDQLLEVPRNETVDPILLFSPEPILQPREAPIAREQSVANHVQELHAPFNMPIGYFQPAETERTKPEKIADRESLNLNTTSEWPIVSSMDADLSNPVARLEASTNERGDYRNADNDSASVVDQTTVNHSTLMAGAAVAPAMPNSESSNPELQREPLAESLSPCERQALLEAFIEGAQIAPDSMTAPLTPELMRSIGQMLAAAMQGTVELISSRALVKREVKADVTMIVVKNNNPLKFLPDGQTALTQMFGRKVPGFMEPVEAMNDAYEDLRAHQIGVVAGMRAALDDVLKRFNPAHLEKRLKQPTLFDSLLPTKRKAKKWDLHYELFQKIYEESQDDFQELFGKAFLNAYEDEIERFKQVNSR